MVVVVVLLTRLRTVPRAVSVALDADIATRLSNELLNLMENNRKTTLIIIIILLYDLNLRDVLLSA